MPGFQKNTFQINQTLHGYNNGHRLLNSSIFLDSQIERMILPLSDMSGPNMSRGFENYLTGYPLPDISCYALAKTWYAKEMKRPGCVWTHTLLIEFSDLANINNLESLVDLFSRPKGLNDIDEYNEIKFLSEDNKFEYPNETIDINTKAFNRRLILAIILESLYNKKINNVFLVSNNSNKFEKLALAIWSQQWPRLRRDFLFCTGALSIRKIKDRILDFQVVPTTNLPQIRSAMDDGIIIDQTEPFPSDELPKWLDICINDLLVKPNSLFRKFLNEFGSEHKDGRKVFRPLVEIFQYEVEMNWSKSTQRSITQKIANEFPDPDTAQNLKNVLFSRKENQTNWFKGFESSPILLLKELVELGTTNAFKNQSSSIRNLVKLVWAYNNKELLNLIKSFSEKDLNTYENEILKEASNLVQEDDLLEIISSNQEIAPLLVQNNLNLATKKEIWNVSKNIQDKVLASITNSVKSNSSIYKKLFLSIIESGSNHLIWSLITVYPNDTLSLLLKWFDKPKTDWLKSDFDFLNELLKQHSGFIVEILPSLDLKNPILLSLILDSLNLKSGILDKTEFNTWAPLTKANIDIDQDFFNRTKVNLLILAMNTKNRDGVKLASKVFIYVHNTLMKNHLQDRAWNILEKELPTISIFQAWDKCERLRLGLLKCFIAFEWPIDYFTQVFSDIYTLKKIFKSKNLDTTEKQFLKEIKKKVKDNLMEVNPEQRRIILGKKRKRF